jgi:hypothetical protein
VTAPRLLATATSGAPADAAFGFVLGGLGDLDGDGRSEFVLGVDPTTVEVVRSGGNPSIRLSHGNGPPVDFLGAHVEPVGDSDGDGFADLVLGTACVRTDDASGDSCLSAEYELYRGGRDAASESRRTSFVP